MIKEIKRELSKGYTENGDLSYSSTLNANLDFFGRAGSLRYDYDEAVKLFLLAYVEDDILALKNLLYLRDIRDGYGERDLFRKILLSLLDNNYFDEEIKKVIDYIPEIGRYDDLIYLLNTNNEEAKKYIITCIKAKILEDMYLYSEGKPISLLAKWMPSINTSSKETRKMALYLSRELFEGDNAEYRKTLSKLRKHIGIIETNLTNKDYTFNYNEVPGKALMKYVNAFMRNDEKRYREFLDDLKKDNKKLQEKAEKLMPYEIIRLIKHDEELANSMWDSLDKTSHNLRTIVVRDGSGSMKYGCGGIIPLDIADALAIYMSERINGDMKNKFITFSSKPELVEFKEGMSLSQKVNFLENYYDCSNTDIEKTYNLIYEVNKNLEKDERIESVIIVSDMQFDPSYCGCNVSTFDVLKKKFEEAGMKLPKMVFWNVSNKKQVFASQDLEYVQYISGFSKNIFTNIVEGVEINAIDLMVNVLSKYDEIFKS